MAGLQRTNRQFGSSPPNCRLLAIRGDDKAIDSVRETVAYYNAAAEEYACKRSDPLVVQRFLERFCALLRRGRILGVGCGPGRDARFFTDCGFEVVGIDLSERLLKTACCVEPRATFLRMDMCALGFAAGLFDGLWVCASFRHIPKGEASATLHSFRKVLGPDGILYLSIKEGEGERWEDRDRDVRLFHADFLVGRDKELR